MKTESVNRGQLMIPIAAAVIFTVGMMLTEQLLAPPYFIKSLIKLLLTVTLIGIGTALSKRPLKECIRFRKMQNPKNLFIIMIAVVPLIWVGFIYMLGNLDLPTIRQNLMQKEQLTKGNCLFVFAYITLVNSFLEEAFFRGFLTEAFRRANLPQTGTILSALTFAVYHLGIVDSWLSIPMLLLCIAALFAAALFLQWICDHYHSMKASWLVHGCANIAINTIGAILIFRL